jgi:hypothetical protein
MERLLTLHFIDGSKLSFEYETQGQNAAARQMKLNDFMTSKHLVVEAEGNVLIFPISSIKYMALSMASTKGAGMALPRHAIVGARIRS